MAWMEDLRSAGDEGFMFSRVVVPDFAQDELPCLTEDGKIIVDEDHKAARAPNGNGGLFSALVK